MVASFKESLHFTLRTFQFRTRAHLSWAFIPLVSKQQQPSSTVACRRDRTAENAVTTFYPISAEILGLAHGNTPSTQAYLASGSLSSCSSETGRDRGPFASMLAPGHTSPRATKYKEIVGKANDPSGYYL